MRGLRSGARRRAALAFAAAVAGAPAVAAAQNAAAGPGQAAAEGPPGNGTSGGREHQPSANAVGTRESNAGISPREASQQDHDLDAIGKQLLDQTPKSPAGSTVPTGGGTTP